MARDSDLERFEARVQATESKLNRIWYILTVLGFLAWAWVDGRFGISTPNAAPMTQEHEQTTTILADDAEDVEAWQTLAESTPAR